MLSGQSISFEGQGQFQPRELSKTTNQWSGNPDAVTFHPLQSKIVQETLRQSVSLVFDPVAQAIGFALGGTVLQQPTADAVYPLIAMLGPLYPEWLGDRQFLQKHGLRFGYMGGSMARGISTTEMCIALAEIGAMGMFGAAGLSPTEVDAAIGRMSAALDSRGLPWGCNLIHSPNDPALEDTLVDLYLSRGVRRVEASAYMRLTKAVVRYACSGLARDANGSIARQNHLFAKVSREEVAHLFMSPAPDPILEALVASGHLTSSEADLARQLPLSEQIIVEADSGGHTDNRPLVSMLPAITQLSIDLGEQFSYQSPIHIGAAGGLGTPEAIAAAFSLGAAFVVLGSVHQSALQSGVSMDSRVLLSGAGPADVGMTASADMFEMGVKVQVLTRGTMMAPRGNRLYEIYRRYPSVDAIPADVRNSLEKEVFRMPLTEVWERTCNFFSRYDPKQLERADRDPKHKLALLCRWYLGNSSRWPLVGEQQRQVDYQLWCGPAMGSFNRWVAGSFLEPPQARDVQQIALNLLEGAASICRAQQLRTYGMPVSQEALRYRPQPLRV